ncbi:hypothetical protein SARC_02247 [Sphaeroforma arctica JP610]|uniref:Coiled-coil domain-containing protein 58 n=1 Tax=Sphaeroforma arctica JP610 TaxID=667725 RepID=A0A0L0G9Q0_9EUKA|nr:hypothetical protein SARC_02247 [Sphaeroforma arctica JP610]KNC85591.1 hypothetical protein SARC_02247 [Sphaeroforma arctica JP610]|eukprot:XP_014159493.1 hypothetical protein SARC_02247 [Sphaeroforma arctica JP610]
MAETRYDGIPCEDFTLFKQAIIKLRKVDDFVVQRLNTAIPTDTFKHQESVSVKQDKCAGFHKELGAAYSGRVGAIENCIKIAEAKVDSLRAARSKDRDNSLLAEEISEKQGNLRMMQNELNYERVIQERSMKVFKERCDSFDAPGV